MQNTIEALFMVRVKIAALRAADHCMEKSLARQMRGKRARAGSLVAIPAANGKVKIVRN